MCDKRLCSCPKKAYHEKTRGPMNEKELAEFEEEYEKFMKTEGHSLMKKHLTREIVDILKTRVTSKGSNLRDVVKSGFANPDFFTGIFAPDLESYDIFAELFDPLIDEYHLGFTKDQVHPEYYWGNIDDFGNVDPEGRYVQSTRVRCARTIEGYSFNPTMTEAHYREIEDKVSAAVSSLKGDLQGTYQSLGSMSQETRQQLIDDHYMFREDNRCLIAADGTRYWPVGRGIFMNEDKTLILWCNEEDHIRIISMEKSGNITSVCDRLSRAIDGIGEHISFVRHPRFGFITFCPENLGSTIRASVLIRLPKLSENFDKFQEIADKHKLQIRGTRGELSESEDFVYDVSNKRRLGLTERDAVLEMKNGVDELIKQEKLFEGTQN